ncbi:MAG: hypothetical protein LBT01_08105 [Spirochaetaceae bacterium]|jgi:hypothetical protein|nr:hypothetical protein [Spirochaetaceae bacterium]
MNRITKMVFFFLFILSVANMLPLSAQESISSRIVTEHPPEQKPFEFPQWAKDLRRADIIMFGVFPFAWLFTSIFVDIGRAADHNWDWSYYTGIGSSSDSKPWANEDYEKALWISAVAAVSVAIIDFVIIKIKRSREAKRARNTAPNESEVIRSPIGETPISHKNFSDKTDTPPPDGQNLFVPAAALSLRDAATSGISIEVY